MSPPLMAHRGTRAPFGQSLRYLGRGPPAEDKLNVDDGVVGHILEVLEKQVHLGKAALGRTCRPPY